MSSNTKVEIVDLLGELRSFIHKSFEIESALVIEDPDNTSYDHISQILRNVCYSMSKAALEVENELIREELGFSENESEPIAAPVSNDQGESWFYPDTRDGDVLARRALIESKAEELGLSLASLAKKAGISEQALRNIRTGVTSGHVNTLKNIAKALDVSVQDLKVRKA